MTQKPVYVGVSNIFLNQKGEILLMKRSEECKTFPGYWGLVAGLVEPNETPQEAAAREAKEEIGVTIQAEKFIGRYYSTPTPHYNLVISLPHYSKIISGTPHPAQLEECSDVKWFTPQEIQKMELAYDHKKILEDEGLI